MRIQIITISAGNLHLLHHSRTSLASSIQTQVSTTAILTLASTLLMSVEASLTNWQEMRLKFKLTFKWCRKTTGSIVKRELSFWNIPFSIQTSTYSLIVSYCLSSCQLELLCAHSVSTQSTCWAWNKVFIRSVSWSRSFTCALSLWCLWTRFAKWLNWKESK